MNILWGHQLLCKGRNYHESDVIELKAQTYSFFCQWNIVETKRRSTAYVCLGNVNEISCCIDSEKYTPAVEPRLRDEANIAFCNR